MPDASAIPKAHVAIVDLHAFCMLRFSPGLVYPKARLNRDRVAIVGTIFATDARHRAIFIDCRDCAREIQSLLFQILHLIATLMR